MFAFLRYCQRIKYTLIDFLLTEKERIFLWLPVSFACGIGYYFSLSDEPSLIINFCVFISSCFMVWDCRKNNATLICSFFIFLFCFGFFLSQCRTFVVSEPRIKLPIRAVYITATVHDVTELPKRRNRLVLKDITMDSFENWKTPERIWLNLPSDIPAPESGDIIGAKVFLKQPYTPATPFAFDFNRFLYFQKIGAVGFLKDGFVVLKEKSQIPIRTYINDKISKSMPKDSAAIAKALVTGSSKSIPYHIVDNYRNAGMAHILSVSGLHMSLLATFVFGFFRTGLALIPFIALRFNTKKIAAVFSLILCLGYLKIYGSSYPAQRAFIMLSFVLSAILLDRQAISVVCVAWAAFFILLFFPESLLSAGFQLSFCAVLALVCAYEAGAGKYLRLSERKESVFFYSLSYLGAVLLTTFIASVATAPFCIFHFRRFPVYSLLGNLLSSSISSVIVMPSLTIGTILIPAGWEKPFYAIASYGIALINGCAELTANLPYAVYQFPPMPLWGLLLAVFGGLWLCLWKNKNRFWGLPVFLFSIFTPFFTVLPDMYISNTDFAFKNKENQLVFKEGNGNPMMQNVWLEENRQKKKISIICPYGLCIYEKHNFKIGYAHTKIGAYDACQMTDLDALFINASFYESCKAKRLFYRNDILKAGTYAVYLRPDKIEITAVNQGKGFRPWTISHPLITLKGVLKSFIRPSGYRIDASLQES